MWIKVYTIFDEVAAGRLKEILEENNVPVDIFYYKALGVFNLFQPWLGKGEIRTLDSHFVQAEKIVADFEEKYKK
ncbi:MAG: hypothetical protein JW734_05810 [Candidatus Omnitrophica bacterium]|nr:hypothetical protein [Candidatus Omnitrophota bacterium]